jgi:hypothetical protein
VVEIPRVKIWKLPTSNVVILSTFSMSRRSNPEAVVTNT